MADRLTGLSWLALGFLGLFAGVWQRRGRDYYPANMLLGLCIGSPGVFWLFWYAYFWGDLDTLRAWSGRTNASLWLYGVEVPMVLWALWLVFRVNTGRAGSAADLTGHLGPPTTEMVEQALVILRRGDRHELLNDVQRKWLAEDRGIRQAAKEAARRRDEGSEEDG